LQWRLLGRGLWVIICDLPRSIYLSMVALIVINYWRS
jgi:hypothetical protein